MVLPGTKEYLISLRPVGRLISDCPELLSVIYESFAVYRTGLIDRGVPPERCETIGGHSSKLAYDAEIFPTKKYGLDKEEMWGGSAWHDSLVEVPPGRDIGRHENISSGIKDKMERTWLAEMMVRVGSTGAPAGRTWNRYQTGANPSMKMLKQLDKFRGGAVEPVVAKIDPEIVREEFFANARDLVTQPFLKWGLNRFIDSVQSGSNTNPEEIYHELLQSHRDFEAQRSALIAVSRRPENYILAFGA